MDMWKSTLVVLLVLGVGGCATYIEPRPYTYYTPPTRIYVTPLYGYYHYPHPQPYYRPYYQHRPHHYRHR